MTALARTSRWLLVPAALLALSSCSGEVSVGSNEVEQSELEKQIGTIYADQTGQETDEVACEGALEAEEGATQRCTITLPDDSLDVDVEATSVVDDTVNFEITEVAP